MAPTVPEGYVGNLNPEHAAKLRELWGVVFKLYDMYESNDPELQAAIKNSAEQVQTPSKSRFGFWKGSAAPNQSQNVIEKYLNLGSSDENSKYELRKKFMDMLAVHTTDSIRSMVVEAVKGDHPDALVLRFLRARKWEVDAALVMMFSAMDWRYNEMKVDSDIMKSGDAKALADEKSKDPQVSTGGKEVMKQLRIGKGFLHGLDKEHRPISYVRVRLHKPFAEKQENLERFIVYLIETGRFALDPPVETACLLFDMTDFTLANMDYVPLKFIIKCFEANYPESLGVILIHNAPWVFKSIWRVIQGWLDPVVASKVNFTYGVDGPEGIERFIDRKQIIKELGGDEDWEYKYVEPVDGENDIMEDAAGKEAIMKERREIVGKFEAATRKWIAATTDEERALLQKERDALAAQSRTNYWKLDPYVRARSLYDRTGVFRAGAEVNWYGDKGPVANGTNSEVDKLADKLEKDVFVDASGEKVTEQATVETVEAVKTA